MKITKELLKELYAIYNKKYFGGVLGKCDFAFLGSNTGFLGWYQDNVDKNGKPKDKIWINKSYDWDEETLMRVLVHEMVHLYNKRIDKCKFNGLLGHGWYFKRQIKRLKNEHGIDLNKKNKPAKKHKNATFLGKVMCWIFE